MQSKSHITLMNVLGISLLTCVPALAVTDQPLSIEYELDGDSLFTQGCFDPCACPIWVTPNISGDFTLIPESLTGTFDVYSVEDVEFTVTGIEGEVLATLKGSGQYTLFQEVAVLHTMTLDLQINGGEPQHFHSEKFSQTTGQFPEIDIVLSVNDFFCFDTVLNISAGPEGAGCAADLDGNGSVGPTDLALLLGAWGPCTPIPECFEDINGDFTVGPADLAMLLGAWGDC